MGLINELNERKKKKQGTTGTSSSGSLIAELNLRKKYNSLPVDDVDDTYIKTFASDANSFFKGLEKDKASYYDANDRVQDLSTRYDTIQGWLYKNKNRMDEKAYKEFSSSLESFGTSLSGVKDYYSQWESKDTFTSWYNKESFINEYIADPAQALQGDYDEAWLKEADLRKLMTAEDFEYYSQLGASIENPSTKEAEGWANIFGWRPGAKDVGNIVSYSRDNSAEIWLGEANGTDMVGDIRYAHMTDNEVKIYNYYLAKYGEEKASEFLASIDDDLNQKHEAAMLEGWKEIANNDPVFASGASVFTSIGSATEYLSDLVTGDDRNSMADVTNTIRGTVSEKVDWEIGNWDAFDFVYNTTMSGVDSLTAGAVFGPVGGGVVLGLSAAGQATNDALDRGLSKDKAFWNGVSAGVFEGLFESVSLGQLSALKEVPEAFGKEIAKNIAKSMLVNASEETLTEIANIAYDMIANGDLSNYEINVRYYMEKGMSESEAKKQAAIDLAGQVVEAGASGALMGAGFGVIGGASQKYNANIQGELYSGNAKELITEALSIDPNNAFAVKLQEKLNSGKRVSNTELYQLVQMNESGMVANDTASIRDAVINRLTELGEDGNVEAIAAALTKQASGEKLSVSERSLIRNSMNGQRVANELNTDNIRSGGYTSQWAEKIGTDRINAEEYGRMLTELEAEDTAMETTEAPAETFRESHTVETPTVASEDFTGEAETVDVTENAAQSIEAAESENEAPMAEEENALTIEDASKKYGAQAGAMVHTYAAGQDVAKYDSAYNVAYDMGKSGVALSYVMDNEATAYLTESQRELAYEAGKAASNTDAQEQDAKNKARANGKTGRRRGTVKGEGVTISDLRKSFNDTQGTAYKLLSTYAEATGVDIVLFKSEADADGNFEGAQGRFKWSEDTIYIDINAGLANIKSVDDLAKYTMLRTFAHEFTHFIEKWNPVQYNEFRRAVFDALTERGENVHDLIEQKQAQSVDAMTYDQASREVVAEAMTDILTDANFVQELAEKHKTIFDKLLEKLKEFVSELKSYFKTIGSNPSREARALQEQVDGGVKYVDSIVKLFDRVAVEAVENYQRTVATEQKTAKKKSVEQSTSDTSTTQKRDTMKPETAKEGKATRTKKSDWSAHDVEWHVPGKKTPIAYSTVATSDLIEVLAEDSPSATITEIMNKVNYDEDAKKVLQQYIDAGYGDQVAYEWFVHDRDQKQSTTPAENTTHVEEDNTNAGEQNAELEGRTEQADTGSHERTPSENGDGRGVSKESAGISGETSGSRGGRVDLIQTDDQPFSDDSFIIPQNGTVEAIEADIIVNEYGVEAYVVKKSAWTKNAQSFARQGRIYIKEGLDESWRGVVAAHEVTHVMKQSHFQPYLDFIERTPEMMNMGDVYGQVIMEHCSEHRKLDLFDMDDDQRVNLFDEINAMMYGQYIAGDFVGEFKEKINGAFYDFDAYINELSSIHEQFKKQNTASKEEKADVENVDNRGTVSQSDADRQGDPQVLDGLQTQDVPRDGASGDPVGDPVQRGQATGRSGLQPDHGGGDVGGHGDGSRESADLRRDDGVTEEPAEALHEEVATEIARKSTEKPRGRNFVIGDSLDLPNGEKARYKANVEAIRLVKRLEAEGRYATEAEQVILSKYVGWGGLANAFDARKADWAKEYAELKELMTEEEYASARGSTLNAHYTDISVIKAMYDGLSHLGFNGGRMLEPSAGVGNFVGAMPAAMSAKVKSWTMVELDGITGLISKYLYPNADVRIQGFEKANIPDNFMDVIISNVPFGNYAINDKAYPKRVTSAIHNYFFAKSLDKVRPGGIVMFITSSYTMNAKDSAVRRYIMGKADLLGAIRLPDSAFKGNAGTEVVTDILILKKREANTPYAGEDFLEAPWTRLQNESYNGAYINSYFTAHPEMVLGTPTMDGGMYRGNSLTYKAFTDRGSLADQIREAFSHIEAKMDYPAQMSREKTNFAVERANKKTKENGLEVKDGKVYQNRNGELVEVKTAKGVAERIAGMLEIRDAARDLMNYQQQGLSEAEIKKARTKLNKAYDAFVKKYGFINAQANKNAIMEDPDRYSILALENWNPDTKKATKADIFSKNTISPNRTVTSAKDVSEGLIVSVNQTGGVDTALIARLTGKTEADVTRELIDGRIAFKNRNGELEAAEVYLSGNVRAKLREAEALVPMDADYQNNVDALRAVIPEDVGYQDIFVNPGTPWIPNSVYSDFVAHMLGGRNTSWRQDVDVTRNAETGNFTIELKSRYLKTNAANTQKWGTPRRSFLDLFDAMLNSKSVVVKDKLDDGSYVINKDATAAANEKMENIQKEFQEWLWQDETRRTELVTLYNETFNSIVTPKYNGDSLTVNGANALKPLRPHQRNAVQRVISSGGNTLLAHKVGAGKTYEMAAAAMKLKELGLVKKPLFAVPKSLVAQWGVEFKDFFPTAKLLVAEASDFTAANRKVFMNRIANGEYDAVIVSYEQFEKLPMSDDFTRALYQEQIDSIVAAIEEAKAEKGDKALSIKDLEKKRKSLQTKIDKLTDKAKDEDNIDFEGLGVDSLFVDEAHNFKNLFYTTSMTNVSGLGNKDGSKRAFDLYTKVRYLQQLNGGRGIVFATATPVMNSMSEMYIMQKYLQPDLLSQLGLSTFDAWAKQFGEVVNGVEIKPSGQGYRVKQSFSRFKNMSELQLLFRNFADVLTDIPGLKIPTMKGGKVNVVVCEPGQFQRDYMKELEKRADNIKNVDPSEDNMLKITSDGRKISYTQRMIDPSLPYEEGCKIFRCADNVVRIYNESKDIKGTQLIFLDMATPKGKSKTDTAEGADLDMDMESAQLYDDIKARLIASGIPAKEIAFIHDADTDQKKKKLFADVNDGKVRVLIGSTGKMGVGMNAQKRVVAIHHLDAPWRPGDVEQRNGRAFRHGNINDEVECFTYVTEGSFDARLWDILERKQNFINQVMNGEAVGRETEDTGEVTLSAAEVKALASGSPLIMEQVQLDTDIKKLESLYRSHISAVRAAKEKLSRDKGSIATLETFIEDGKADIDARKDTYSEGKFSITIGKKTYTDKKEAGIALMAEATAKANEVDYTTVATFAGFELQVVKTHEGIKGMIVGVQGYPFNTYPNNTSFMINYLISQVEGIEAKVKMWQSSLADTRADMAEQEKLIAEPFAKQAELEQKRARYNEVMAILNPKEEQALDGVDDDTVQEQSRAYLDMDEQQQQRTNTLTDREVLEFAAERLGETNLTDGERDALHIFKDRLSTLRTLQEERADQGRLYKEQQFGANVDRAAAAQTLNRMHVLDDKIKAASADVLSVENKAVLGQVLQKARKVVEAEERQHGKEILDRWRDRAKNAAAIKKYRERIKSDVDELSSWVLKPNNKDIVKHIPDALKNTVIPFLTSIDFTSQQQLRGGAATKADAEFVKRLNALKSALKESIDINGMYSGYNDLPPNFMDSLQIFIDSVQAIIDRHSGVFVINQMTGDELNDLSKVVRTLKKYITQVNRFHANAMFQHVWEAGDSTIESLRFMSSNNGQANGVSNFVFWQQMRPAYAFERFGEGGMAIYDGLRRGQAKLAFNTNKIVEFAEKAYTSEEVNAWEKEVKEFKLGGDTVKIPVSFIMSFYELSKQTDSLRHMLKGGIRVATYKKGGKKISDNGHAITEADVKTIIGALTDRQKEVADSLQKFMAEQGGAWGNYVSVKRFGEELFGNPQYFPINSDGRHLQSTADEQPSAASLYALLNMSFTKSRNEHANNRIILYNIFDVFSNHMASMAQYNAMALPVLDALKWFNYQQKAETPEGERYIIGSVREQMARVYGVPEESRPGSGRQGYAETFVSNIIKAFNGTEAQGVPTDSMGVNTLRRYNMAQVAYNFRVVVQQPLAITRAALLIDYGSILKGMKLSPKAIQGNIEEMRKYSGIAAWKSLGFYDVNISRGLSDIIKHKSTIGDKISDVGMWGAEKADTITWAAMWSACKEEVTKKQKLKPGDHGFYEAVTKLFEEVIYKTQVVDSILTKNEYMRSKGFFARAIGSFMSEPTTTASMVVNAYDKYHMDMQRGMSSQQAWKKNGKLIGRTIYVYAVSQTLLAAVQAIADAFRDDDEYEDFLEKWLEAFGGNLVDELMLFNKLPILSDFYDLAKEVLSILGVDTYGNPPQSVFMQWYDSLVKGVEIINDRITGEDTNYTWYGGIYKLLQAVSGMAGLPMASATREIITIWNNTVGTMAPSLKVNTYDAGDMNEVKYAYADGYLTAEEAAALLLEKGLVDNEDEAYFTIQGWEAGEGYSRYDAIYDAVRNGGDFDSAMAELTSHGYYEDDVFSKVKSKVGEWYRAGEITKAQAISMLDKYTSYGSEDITKTVNKWSSQVVTGIAYEDIGDEFMAGNISASRALEMYRLYGSMTQDEAYEKVSVLAFVKEHPECEGISYSAVESYTVYCEPLGMDAAVFYDAWQYNSSTRADVDENGESISGSKKAKVLSYIDSLYLTARQKDSLYYAFGWAESKIHEAPWR